MARNQKNTSRKRKQLPLPQIVLIIGLVMCMAPVISHLWLTHQAAENVSTMKSVAASVDPKEKAELLEQAHAYNNRLAGIKDDFEGEIWEYDRQLAFHGDEAIASLEIPRIGLAMTVYHGVEEPALSMGIGHQPEFSLPVGGEGCHIVLSGHSGMRQYRVFDGIRALEKGDVFGLNVLGDMYAYRVTGWEIVDPSDPGLKIEKTGDRCTLVTCTTTPDQFNPKGAIGINDKRLLVHGERCEYDEDEFHKAEISQDMSVFVNDNTRPAILAAILIALFLLILLISNQMRRQRKKRLKAEAKVSEGVPEASSKSD